MVKNSGKKVVKLRPKTRRKVGSNYAARKRAKAVKSGQSVIDTSVCIYTHARAYCGLLRLIAAY